ncbi:MAG: alpha/beta hydrolase [Bifidobacterium aquikefiri]|uniref:Alpha/beta hydrolase n=1 Tax=Bifidobacterium aquikefiri TaxID=1653207 RepID=A0A261G327_9BIFI|nr:alpha/beta hydrolase [Bifidobacterium aquikefiri]OZG65810.1 alpha/beta hydrolase [Bifidobacterium aquikefiri]
MTMKIENTTYRDGFGIPLVLIHAFPIDHRMWDECAQAICDLSALNDVPPFSIYAPQMPGAGTSEIPTAVESGSVDPDGAYPQALERMTQGYAELLKSLGHTRAIWVGLSMGGYVALMMQKLHPEMVAGIALCDTKAQGDAGHSRENRLNIARQCEKGNSVDPVMGFAKATDKDSSVKQSAAFIRKFTAWLNEQSPEGVAWRERMAAGRPDLSDVLPQITVPAAIVSGDKDPSSPPAVMKELQQAMTSTDASFTAIEDCGHFSAVEHPEQVARALLDLVGRVHD